MKYLILLLLPFSISCSSTTKAPGSNDKKIARIVLSLKNENFQEAKKLLNSVNKNSKGIVKYNVHSWSELNPIREYKFSTMEEYLERLEKFHNQPVSCTRYVDSKSESYHYKLAIECLENLKKNANNHHLYNRSFISGDYRLRDGNIVKPTSVWTPKWVYQCRKKPYYCSMFGKITNDTKLSGASAFMEYWVDKKLKSLKDIFNQKHAQEANEKLRSDIQEKAYKNSPKFMTDKICEYQRNVAGFKNGIKKEKEAAKYSGVVDSKKLYDLGKAISLYESWAKNLKAEYKTKFKKTWVGNCK